MTASTLSINSNLGALSVCTRMLSHAQLSVTPWTVRPPGSSVHGIFQARTLEWVAIPFSRGCSRPGIEPGSPALQADSLPFKPPGKPI